MLLKLVVFARKISVIIMVKVLIIDDSEIIRERLSILLGEIDNVEIVGVAACAAEGLDMVNSYNPEFIILDISLPDTSGIEVLKVIKKNHPQTCVVMLTNYPYLPYRTKCMAFGADYFFDKSVEFTRTKKILMQLVSETFH